MKPSISGRRISSCMAIQVPNDTPAIQHCARIRVLQLQPVERGGRVRQLARPVVEVALAAPHAAEIEAQHREATLHEHVVERVHDLVVHRAPELRVGMQDERDWAVGGGLVVVAGLEAPGRPVDDQLWHASLRSRLGFSRSRRRALQEARVSMVHKRCARAPNILDLCARNFHISVEFRTVRKS